MEEKKRKNEFFHDCALIPNVPNTKKEDKITSSKKEIGYIAGVH